MALLNPIELIRSGKSLDDLLVVTAFGTILKLQEIPTVKREHIRTKSVDGKPIHYVNVAFFDGGEEIEVELYLEEMRGKFPHIIFSIKL
jgi:hypothetical protein